MRAQIHTIAFWGIETIALDLMVAMDVVPRDAVEDALVLGELALVGGGLRAKLAEFPRDATKGLCVLLPISASTSLISKL